MTSADRVRSGMQARTQGALASLRLPARRLKNFRDYADDCHRVLRLGAASMRPSSKLSLPASVAVLLLGLACSARRRRHRRLRRTRLSRAGARPSLERGALGEIGGGPVRARQQRHPRDLQGRTHSGSDPRTGTLSKTVNAGQPVTLKLLVTGGTGLRVRWTLAGPGRLRIKRCTAVGREAATLHTSTRARHETRSRRP